MSSTGVSRRVTGFSTKTWARHRPRQTSPKGVGNLDGMESRGDEGAVERPGGHANDQVPGKHSLVQGAQQPDLDRADAGPSGENEGDRFTFAHTSRRVLGDVSYRS